MSNAMMCHINETAGWWQTVQTSILLLLITTVGPLMSWQSRDSISTVAPPCSFRTFECPEWHSTVEITWLSRYERCYCKMKIEAMDCSVSPGFIIAVEVFFTVGFGLAGLASLILIFTLICGENRSLLRAIGILFLTAGMLIDTSSVQYLFYFFPFR